MNATTLIKEKKQNEGRENTTSCSVFPMKFVGALFAATLLCFRHDHAATAQLVTTTGADVCPMLGCCVNDCCGAGTSWNASLQYCVEDDASSGFNGVYSPDYRRGCFARVCCEGDCCGQGTQYSSEAEECRPLLGLGESCEQSAECKSGWCYELFGPGNARICVCIPDTNQGCSDDQFCAFPEDVFDAPPGCFPLGNIMDSCSASSECFSGNCHSGMCMCNDITNVGCADDETCMFEEPYYNCVRQPLCSSDCPCCNPSEWPEFVAAVDAYSGDDDKCFTRDDATSFILALNDCESGDVAYMSYDYQNSGGTKEEPVYYCGTSSSDRNFLTKSQIMACEAVLNEKVKNEGGECGSSFC